MAKVNSFEQDAAAMAERIQQARDAGQQLTFLPDEAAPGDSERTKRGKGKATSELRNWLAARGMRLPEDVLTEMAGMASSDDAFVTAMARTEQVLAWAEAGAVGYKASPASPSMAQRLGTFQFIFTAQLRAAEALLPYGLAKVTPDAGNTVVNQIIMPGATAPAAPGDRANAARDITPQARRMAPPPLPTQIQQNQGLEEEAFANSDAAIRTQEASN
jgi:hypothetical protein